MRWYTTIKTEEVQLINFDWVYESIDTLVYSNDGSRFIISFDDEYVDEFMNFNGLQPMDLNAAHMLLKTSEWLIISEDI